MVEKQEQAKSNISGRSYKDKNREIQHQWKEELVFKKTNEIDNPLANLTKRKRRPTLSKLEMKRRISQQILLKFRG
jgi:hypothetical protein